MYELLCREFGSDTGVFFTESREAIAEAQPGDEVWQVADDTQRTRVLKVWPEPHHWHAHTVECPARAGSVFYCECGADPSRARGQDAVATREP